MLLQWPRFDTSQRVLQNNRTAAGSFTCLCPLPVWIQLQLSPFFKFCNDTDASWGATEVTRLLLHCGLSAWASPGGDTSFLTVPHADFRECLKARHCGSLKLCFPLPVISSPLFFQAILIFCSLHNIYPITLRFIFKLDNKWKSIFVSNMFKQLWTTKQIVCDLGENNPKDESFPPLPRKGKML